MLVAGRNAVSRGLSIGDVCLAASGDLESSSTAVKAEENALERCSAIKSMMIEVRVDTDERTLSWLKDNVPWFDWEFATSAHE